MKSSDGLLSSASRWLGYHANNDGQVRRTEDVLSAGRLAAIALLLATAVVETAAKLRSLKLVVVCDE